MTKLLLKLFVKNFENKESSAVRTKVGTLSGIVGKVSSSGSGFAKPGLVGVERKYV